MERQIIVSDARIPKEEPITKFPITADVVAGSLTRRKILDRGDVVKCLRCGQKFYVNEKTAVMLNDNVPCLRCNNPIGEDSICRYTASVLYYFPEEEGANYVRARHW